jgi:hypothetical protein
MLVGLGGSPHIVPSKKSARSIDEARRYCSTFGIFTTIRNIQSMDNQSNDKLIREFYLY